MEISFYILLLVAHFGAFDVLYFHIYKGKLHLRPECQREVFWHTFRHLIYALQFIWVANLRFHGWALLFLGILYFWDLFIAWADVLEENQSRTTLGGLSRGEYFMHVALSLMIGCYFMATFQAVWPDRNLDTAIVFEPPAVPLILWGYMSAMGGIALVIFLYDLYQWLTFRRTVQQQVQIDA